jgi:hypothetical protein
MDGDAYDAGQQAARRGVLMMAIGALSVDPAMSGQRLLRILAQDIDERGELPVSYKEALQKLGIELE